MAHSEANLLFGILALQLRFVSSEQLVSAGAAWATDQERDLGDILVAQGALTANQQHAIAALISEQLAANHGNAAEVYQLYGGDQAAQTSFGGSLVFDTGDQLDSSPQYASLAAPVAGAPSTSRGGSSAGTAAPGLRSGGLDTLPPEQPGRYRVRGEQGRGGIGRVLIAFDEAIHREIALKELLPSPGGSQSSGGSDNYSPQRRSVAQTARFLREARITGQLEHPGIVPVYELGRRADGTVYYTMKLVRGATLADKLKACRDLSDRLALLPHFLDLCQAIAYAHSRGVTHRDIKPANVMVGEFGETVLLDWGLAKVKGQADEGAEKLADEVRLLKEAGAGESVAGSPIGTPSYMPPEQADGRIADVDERSDVWSLGAVLYELLTGQPPFTGVTAFEVIGAVLSDEVLPVLERAREAPPELAAIAMRCLQRDPARRYPSVEQLAADVTAFTSGGLVGAYRYSTATMLRRWVRRSWPVLATALLALLILCLVGVYSYTKVIEQRNTAVSALARLDKRNNELLGLQLAAASREQLAAGQSERASLLALQAARFYGKSNRWMPEIDRALRECIGAPRYARIRQGALGNAAAANVDYAALFPDGRRLATVSGQGLAVWDLAHPGSPPVRVEQAQDRIAISPDGKWLATARKPLRGEQLSELEKYAVLLWDATDFSHAPRLLTGLTGGIRALAISPDGRYVAAGGEDSTARVWELARPDAPARVLTGATAKIMFIAFSPDGHWVATTSKDASVRLWDLTDAAVPARLLIGHTDQVYCAAFTPDGRRLATCGQDGRVLLWDITQPAAPPREKLVYPGGGILTAVTISPDGRMLAVSGYDDKLLRLWPLDNLQASPVVLRGHENAIGGVVFSPDGRQLLSWANDSTARLWDLTIVHPEPRILADQETVMSVAVSSDGRLAAGGATPPVAVYALAAPQQAPLRLTGPADLVRAVAISADGKFVAGGSYDKHVWLWDLSHPGSAPRSFPLQTGFVRSVAFSPDNRWLAWGIEYGKVSLVDLSQPAAPPIVHECSPGQAVRYLAFSPDGKMLAAAVSAEIRLLSIPGLQQVGLLKGHQSAVTALAFTRDGRRLASSSWDTTVRLWQLKGPRTPSLALKAGDTWLYAVALSPDGRFLAAGGKDNSVRLWELDNPLAVPEILLGHQNTVTGLAFTADSRQLISGSLDATVRIWDVGHERLVELAQQGPWRNLSLGEWQRFIGPDQPYERTLPGLPPGNGAAEGQAPAAPRP